MGLLENKIALVTGGGGGIGSAITRAFAREGARVVVTDVDRAAGEACARQLREAGGEVQFLAADAGDPADWERLTAAIRERYGRLDCACNNAGVSHPPLPLAELALEDWDRVLRVNLSSVFYGMRQQIPLMVEGGGGAIVNIASVLGVVTAPVAPAYSAAKHGVVGLTQSAAVDYASRGIRVNAVAPGFISTAMTAGLEADPAVGRRLRALHPLGRLGRPEEVAELVVWLCSERAAFVTGACYAVDGGYLAR